MRGLSDLLAGLSRRERRLTGLMVALALPVAAVFLGIEPLIQSRAEAARDLAAAQDLRRWITDQARAYPPLAEDNAVAQRAAGLAGLEQSLVATGLRDQVAALSGRGAGGIDLRFDAVVFTDLMGWAARLEADLGYRIEGMTIEPLDSPGRVSARLLLEPVS